MVTNYNTYFLLSDCVEHCYTRFPGTKLDLIKVLVFNPQMSCCCRINTYLASYEKCLYDFTLLFTQVFCYIMQDYGPLRTLKVTSITVIYSTTLCTNQCTKIIKLCSVGNGCKVAHYKMNRKPILFLDLFPTPFFLSLK